MEKTKRRSSSNKEVMNPKPRDSLLIVRDILQAASKRATKTEVVYRSNINFVAAERYITKLMTRGMLETVLEDGKSKFQTTQLGLDTLSKLTEVHKLVNGP